MAYNREEMQTRIKAAMARYEDNQRRPRRRRKWGKKGAMIRMNEEGRVLGRSPPEKGHEPGDIERSSATGE